MNMGWAEKLVIHSLKLGVNKRFLRSCFSSQAAFRAGKSSGKNPSGVEGQIHFDYTPGKFQKALESGKPTVLQLAANWCSFCVKREPMIQELKNEFR
jgi:thiol-disulfide isomerase/thioredoxin